MEECEKLCSTLTIIKKGKIECIGSYSEIKSKYGEGFSLSIKCERGSEPSNDVDILEEFLIKTIPGSTIKGALNLLFNSLFFLI